MKINMSKESCLYQSSLGEFLVDLWLIHDTLGPVSIVQSAQSFLQLHYKSTFLIKKNNKRNSTKPNSTSHTSRLMEAGDTVAIMEVLVRPPSESCSMRVSLDSL